VATDDLVVDASVVVKAALVAHGFDRLAARRLHAPTLLWSEVTAAVRQLEWRGELERREGDDALARLAGQPVNFHGSATLSADAIALARQHGWAKTYDAEYVALARRLDATFATLDARLARSARGLARIVAVTEL
jgi:predicted nucleic acid-binding protein